MNTLVLLCLLCAAAMPTAYGLGRIVGGNETTIEKRPYVASLQFNVGPILHHCGASIISDKFLLTSAQCDPESLIVYLYARVGSTRYGSGGQSLKVATFKQHPNYNPNVLDYDLAIVGFEAGVTITMGPNVAVIPLTNTADPIDGSIVTVMGWGVTYENSTADSLTLKEVDLPVVNIEKCREIYGSLTDQQICFGGTPEGNQGACYGDAGGPAVQNGTQYALVSGGNGCEAPNVPGVYGKISSGRLWIWEETGV